MSEKVFEITIDTNASEAVKALQRYPRAMAEAIFKAFDEATTDTVANIQARRLRGQGPFPVRDHKLGRVTGTAARSLFREGPKLVKDDEVVVSIGTALGYFQSHELGFSGTVRVPGHNVKAHRRRLAKPKGRKKFAKVKGHRRKEHKMKMNVPARAPIEWGIRDLEPEYSKGISRAIVRAWDKLKHFGST